MALYRECRPTRFKEIVGQVHVTRTLQNAIAQNRLAHAYLFCGPRGTGKTTTARVLAKALNCPDAAGGEPCGVCQVCRGIAGGEGVDVVEMDAASNRGIDEIRTLRERVRLAPVGGRFKVYVIDEVHMLTTEAFNALLKTIEEPPANVVFVLCTTEAYRVPPTIVSRCQRFDFHPIATQDIAGYLGELIRQRGFEVEPAAARFIARVSTGSLRDALSILDQCMAYASGPVTLEAARNVVGALDGQTLVQMAGALTRGDAGGAFGNLERLMSEGRDAREVARGLATHMRDLVLYRLSGQGPELLGPAADDPQALKAQAAAVSDAFLYEAVDALSTVENEMRYAAQPRLALEARLLRLCGLAAAVGRGEAGSAPAAQDADGGCAAGPQVASADAVAAGIAGPEAPAQKPRRAPATARQRESNARQEGAEGVMSSARPEAVTVPPASPGSTTKAQAHSTPGAAAGSLQRTGPGSEGLPAFDLERAWPEIRAQLPVNFAGLLDGSSLVWERGRVWILLPSGRGALAEHLGSSRLSGIVSGLLARPLRRKVEVGVRVVGGPGGLFGGGNGVASPDAAEAAGVGEPGLTGRSSPAGASGKVGTVSRDAGRQSGGARPDVSGNGAESLSRRAEALFGAEEVGKGDEQGDEPR